MLFLVLCCVFQVLQICEARPNIVLIVADDLGWNDVGFHGSNQIPTPNIDALAFSGLILNNYYVAPICTPSRSALMTAKFPIHTGMQHNVIKGMEPRGLPLSEKILPQYMKDLGYRTHLVGKWHLGHYKKEYLPLYRGFDTHLGFWTGKIDMFDHINAEYGIWGFDFRRGFQVAHDLFGQYATDIYTKEAVKVISSHNSTDPLFLVVAHSAMHSGNPSEPIRAPDDVIDKFAAIIDLQRRKYAGVLSKLDESVGKVVEALQSKDILENTIIVFTTDNGGPAAGFNDNAASNYPLKGVKNTLWEGGVRGAAFIWSPRLKTKPRVALQRMHIVDWLPTFYSAAGGNSSIMAGVDGIDMWSALSTNEKSARSLLVHNIDDALGFASISVDQWKVHKGTNYKGAWDQWYGPSGREGSYDLDLLYANRAGKAIGQLGMMPAKDKVTELRESATLQCDQTLPTIPCKPFTAPCLFNIEEDPCERRNLAGLYPDILETLIKELDTVNRTAVPPIDQPVDPRGDPKLWGRIFTNFGDYELPSGYHCA